MRFDHLEKGIESAQHPDCLRVATPRRTGRCAPCTFYRRRLSRRSAFFHAKWREAPWRVVGGLLKGQQLWLTELGRSLPGACSIKHRVKVVDRFVGSCAVQLAVPRIYAALAVFFCSALRTVPCCWSTGTRYGCGVSVQVDRLRSCVRRGLRRTSSLQEDGCPRQGTLQATRRVRACSVEATRLGTA